MFSCLFGQISAERNVKLLVDATVKSIQEKKDWVNQSIPPPSKADEADNIRGIGMFLLCDLMDIPAKDLPHVKAMGLDTPPKELIRNMLKKALIRSWPQNNSYNFKDEAQALEILFPLAHRETIRLPLPPPYRMDSPEGLSWLITHELGGVFITRAPARDNITGNAYAIDLSIFRDVEMKKHFVTLDVAVYLRALDNGEVRIEGISHHNEPEVAPGNPEFGRLARLTGTALSNCMGVVNHGLYIHIVTSESFTFANKKCLPPEHPLRRLTCRCEYGNEIINEGAASLLLANHGAFCTYLGITYKGLRQLLDRGQQKYNLWEIHCPPVMLTKMGVAEKDLPAFPVLQEMLEWWKLLEAHCDEYIRFFYPDDAAIKADKSICGWYNQLHELLKSSIPTANLEDVTSPLREVIRLSTVYMFVSTVHHEIAGSAMYRLCSNPYVISPVYRDGPVLEQQIASVYTAILRCNAMASTSVRTPKLMQPWGHHAPPGPKCEEAKKILNSLLEKAKALDQECISRNQNRRVPYESLISENLECSVAI